MTLPVVGQVRDDRRVTLFAGIAVDCTFKSEGNISGISENDGSVRLFFEEKAGLLITVKPSRRKDEALCRKLYTYS